MFSFVVSANANKRKIDNFKKKSEAKSNKNTAKSNEGRQTSQEAENANTKTTADLTVATTKSTNLDSVAAITRQ